MCFWHEPVIKFSFENMKTCRRCLRSPLASSDCSCGQFLRTCTLNSITLRHWRDERHFAGDIFKCILIDFYLMQISQVCSGGLNWQYWQNMDVWPRRFLTPFQQAAMIELITVDMTKTWNLFVTTITQSLSFSPPSLDEIFASGIPFHFMADISGQNAENSINPVLFRFLCVRFSNMSGLIHSISLKIV